MEHHTHSGEVDGALYSLDRYRGHPAHSGEVDEAPYSLWRGRWCTLLTLER